MNLETNHIYSLNATGSRLWELLADQPTREELVDALASEFDVGRATVEQEADDLLASLNEAKLVSADGN